MTESPNSSTPHALSLVAAPNRQMLRGRRKELGTRRTNNAKCLERDTGVVSSGGGRSEKGIEAIDVLVRRGMKNIDFCLLITKDGVLLLQEKCRNEIIPGAFGYSSVHIREHDHPSGEAIEKRASEGDRIMIPFDSIRKVHFRRGFSISTMRRGYIISLSYMDSSGTQRTMSALLTPPTGRSGPVSTDRLTRKMVIDYAMEVKRILVEASPLKGVLVADV